MQSDIAHTPFFYDCTHAEYTKQKQPRTAMSEVERELINSKSKAKLYFVNANTHLFPPFQRLRS